MSYTRAGFEVVGIDYKPQPHYPFEFYQADALEYLREHGAEFDVVHASPPCQRWSILTPPAFRKNHPDLISATRTGLQNCGKPFVIENVRGAMGLLESPLMLCGTMFGLTVRRHRYFEICPKIAPPVLGCDHTFYPVLISGTHRRKSGRFEYSAQACRDAADLQWMTRKGMDEAIPPAFTEWIGTQLINALRNKESGFTSANNGSTKAGVEI
jgi:DNA (cytosine-5)-methyltransferase 1